MKQEQMTMEIPEVQSRLMCDHKKWQLVLALNKACVESVKYRGCITPDHFKNILSKVMFGFLYVKVDKFADEINKCVNPKITPDHQALLMAVAKMLYETGCVRNTNGKAVAITGKITGPAAKRLAYLKAIAAKTEK